MPAFFTHYLFGRLQYEGMEQGRVRTAISGQKKAYALGLAGPDIFFYFLPDFLLGKKKTGSVMHEEHCGRFLRNMVREVEKLAGEEQEIALAYLAGFLGHYELDTHCHPYIYSYIDREAERIEKKQEKNGVCKRVSNHQKTGIHFQYEAAMDYYFLEHYGRKKPVELNQNCLTRLNRTQRKVIAGLVARAYNQTYAIPHLSVQSMWLVLASVRFVMWGIRDSHGCKEAILYPLEKLCYGYPFSSGLLVNNHRYGVGREEFMRLQSLFEQGRGEYARVLACLEGLLRLPAETSEAGKKENRQRLFAQIGSRSYHSGETVR